MKNRRRQGIFWLALALALITTVSPELHAQTVTLVSPAPESGTFWSLQRGDDVPALPFIPPFLSSAPVYSLGDGHYLYDDLDFDYAGFAALIRSLMSAESVPPPPDPGEDEGDETEGPFTNSLLVTNLWLEITPAGSNGNDIVLTITNVPSSQFYDLFRTFELVGNHLTNSVWRWIGRGTNGQSFVFPGVRCGQGFYVVGFDADSDSDGLTDAFELLVSKSLPATNHTFSIELDDREWWLRSNVLVNDPQQDCGTEQNTQFESTCVVLGTNVIVAWVDSNQGVYGLGSNLQLTNYTPRLVAYAVCRDGGATFADRGLPPLSRAGGSANEQGDAGDPVLAVDAVSQTIYLAGTSPRNAGGWKGIPLWKSSDGGLTFGEPIIVRDDIIESDKPWLVIDNGAGTGQHDGYLGCTGKMGTSPNQTNGVWLSVSTDGSLATWLAPILIRRRDADNVMDVHPLIPLIGPDHTGYAFWLELTTDGTNWIKMRKIENRGESLGQVRMVAQLATTNTPYGNLNLLRGNDAGSGDTFRAFPLPVPAVNPTKTNHLYVAYADWGTNGGDKADVFFLSSINGGTNWSSPTRVSTLWTNDQWMPVLAVKPDGTQLFLAWYDRRNDTNNSLIDVYARFGNIASNGQVTLATNDFRITSTNFPPVFAGTLTSNTNIGHYDPVYPPEDVNLHWWYPDWSTNSLIRTTAAFISHVGEYNGVCADEEHVYFTWTDYRLPTPNAPFSRSQGDIRFVRLKWPN